MSHIGDNTKINTPKQGIILIMLVDKAEITVRGIMVAGLSPWFLRRSGPDGGNGGRVRFVYKINF
jgi:hypothetical protein